MPRETPLGWTVLLRKSVPRPSNELSAVPWRQRLQGFPAPEMVKLDKPSFDAATFPEPATISRSPCAELNSLAIPYMGYSPHYHPSSYW